MIKTKRLLPACVLLILSASVHRLAAQTLSIGPASLGTITHQYQNMMGQGTDSQALSFSTPAVQLINYDTIQVAVSAPAGEAWNISYDGQGLNNASLEFDLNFGNGFSGPGATINSSSVQFDLVSGSSADLSSSLNYKFVPNAGYGFQMGYRFNVSGDVAFTGFTATISYDNSTLAATALADYLDSAFSYSYNMSDPSASDPGQLLTVQAAPEPSTMALVGVGGFGFALLRLWRRR
jgi:hypothetical protein